MGKDTLNKMLEFIGVSKEQDYDDDDTYEEDEDFYEDNEPVIQPRHNRTASTNRYQKQEREVVNPMTRDTSQQEDFYEARRRRAKLSSIPGGAPAQTLLIHSPATYNESQNLVLQLKQNKQVIIKLDTIDTDIAQRILDFMSGAAFALEAQVTKISKGIYLFTSNDTKIEKAEPEPEISNEGFYTLDESFDTTYRR